MIDNEIKLLTFLKDEKIRELILSLKRKTNTVSSKRDDVPLIHLAVMHQKKDLIGALVEIGVDVNAKDEQGRTALMKAAAKDWTVGVWALLEKGARIDLRDQKGQTAYVWAFNHRSLGSLLLLKHFNKPRLIKSYQLKRKAKVLSKIKKGPRQKG